MCFIKVGDPLSPCEHEECKKTLEAFKVQNCLYNNYPLQASGLYNVKRSRPEAQHLHSEISQEVLKRMKFDKDENCYSNENSENVKNFMNSSSCFQPMQTPAPTINFLVQPNSHSSQYNHMNNMYNKAQQAPLALYPNYNNSYNEAMLNLQFRMKCNNNPQIATNTPCQEKEQKQPCDLDKQIWSTLMTQNTLLIEMKEKTNILTQVMGKIMHDFNDLQKTVSSMACEKSIDFSLKKESEPQSATDTSLVSQAKYFINSSEISKADDLIQYLYLNKSHNFEYQLIQNKPIELPLYRERNFSFSVQLKDLSGKDIFHTNRIPLSIAIYTYENPPKCIDTNTSGNKILKGYAEKDLVNGSCSFDKIQIKEVTSHFRKGKVFIVVYPKMPTFGNLPQENVINSFIEYTTIKPLVIESVVVKAKKLPTFLKKFKKIGRQQHIQKEEKISSICSSEKVSIFEDDA